MTTYLCPDCGSPMVCMSTASIPPIITYECFGCGYRSKPVKEMQSNVTLPPWLRREDIEPIDSDTCDGCIHNDDERAFFRPCFKCRRAMEDYYENED